MPDARAIRVLLIVEAVTLAHVARSTVLARALDPAEFTVSMACDPRFDFLFDAPPFRRIPISSIPGVAFDRALDRGSPIYDAATLERYVKDDLAAIDAIGPDVVVGDFRLSLSISTRLAGVPFVNVTNAGWSPYATPRFPVPDLALTRIVGVPAAQWMFDRIRPFAFAMHAAPLNRVRRCNGLPPLPRDLRHAYTDADQVLYADLPEVIATHGAPATHRYLGPVLWSPDLPDPDWAATIPADRPVVYVNLGSSGRASSLASVLIGLESLPVTVVAATGGRGDLPPEAPHRFSAPFLAGDRWARRASVVVCNGGSPSCYQALSHGVPVVGVPGNLDQFLNMAAVEAAGGGTLVRAGRDLGARLREAVEGTIARGRHRVAAERLGRSIAATDPPAVFRSALRAAVGRSALSG